MVASDHWRLAAAMAAASTSSERSSRSSRFMGDASSAVGERPTASTISRAHRPRSARRARSELPFSACSADSFARFEVSHASVSSATDAGVESTARTVSTRSSQSGDTPDRPPQTPLPKPVRRGGRRPPSHRQEPLGRRSRWRRRTAGAAPHRIHEDRADAQRHRHHRPDRVDEPGRGQRDTDAVEDKVSVTFCLVLLAVATDLPGPEDRGEAVPDDHDVGGLEGDVGPRPMATPTSACISEGASTSFTGPRPWCRNRGRQRLPLSGSRRAGLAARQPCAGHSW